MMAENQQVIQPSNNQSQQIPETKSSIYGEFINNIHPYHNLLHPILCQLQGIFDIKSEPEPKVPQTDYSLKIYITQSQDQKLNSFVYTFSFPITLQEYKNMCEDFELQKKFDTNLEKYELIKEINENTEVVYLSYKKVLFIASRDFIYVRYTFQYGNEYWSIITSIPGEDECPGIIRGRIIKGATRVVETQGKINVWVYSQIDMKMTMKPESTKAKGVLEIKKYIQKWYEYIKPQPKQSLQLKQ